jgi:hypothetical protein
MTWQGGKKGREPGPFTTFARLAPLAAAHDDAGQGLEKLAHALSNFGSPVRIHIRFVGGPDGEAVEHWEVQAGAKVAKAQPRKPKTADVIVAMKPETWSQIAQGRLTPYDALYGGKLRVGGDLDMAKAITRHLTDPSASYVAPC